MKKQQYIDESPRRRGRKRKPTEPLDIEQVHQKNGFYDGKIFFSYDKVTYTFVYEGTEVIVLHFDLNKSALFLKGHRLVSLDIHPELQTFLAQFKRCLMDNPKTQKFVKPFDTVVSTLGDLN